MKKIFLIPVLAGLTFFSCKNNPTNVATPTIEIDHDAQEAREDSIKLANAYKAQEGIKLSVTPILETQTVEAKATDDAADDPAIWINPNDATKSFIYGSNKKGGIATYDLDGKEIAYDKLGKINNIDVLDNYLGGTNRTVQSLDIFSINPETGKINLILQHKTDTTKVDDIYGFCFAKDKTTNKAYAVINGKNGVMEQYEIKGSGDKISTELVRTVKFDSQVEGMVADAEYGTLYVGQEDRGVWKLSIDPSSTEKTFLTQSERANNPMIDYDVEGLTLLENGKDGYIVASSQGNFSYALFDRKAPHNYVTSFKVTDAEKVDGTQETDGLEINTTPIGDKYPKGIMVIQDGFNYEGKELRPQNFKYVSVADLINQIK